MSAPIVPESSCTAWAKYWAGGVVIIPSGRSFQHTQQQIEVKTQTVTEFGERNKKFKLQTELITRNKSQNDRWESPVQRQKFSSDAPRQGSGAAPEYSPTPERLFVRYFTVQLQPINQPARHSFAKSHTSSLSRVRLYIDATELRQRR